ncbi:MAG: hypothetical protein OXG44_08100 [Gammaproteobacteria bacterium]|nr:hypothetical protein [Gammaproteobacteria bacterium]MDE0190355.1 hypothetical protein [Gammaproteobacteria bacterium]
MNDKLKAALIGGVTFGIASGLPYIGAVNIACCALYIGGGVLAAYLVTKDLPPQARAPYRDGAVVGVLAGLFGGIANVITSLIARALGYDPAAEMAAMFQQFDLAMPEGIGVDPSSGMQLIGFVINIVMYVIFATIGGLVGVAIFHKKEAPSD